MSRHDKDQKIAYTENRDLSWILFNQRVQQEADNPDNPLLERVKFLSIVSSNMDEFFQVRYYRLKDAAREDKDKKKLYKKVAHELIRQSDKQTMLYNSLKEELCQAGILLYPAFSLNAAMLVKLRTIFSETIEPYLKASLLDNEKIKQKQIYLLAKVSSKKRNLTPYYVIALPSALPKWFDISVSKDARYYIRTDDIVKLFISCIFPKTNIERVSAFRILRNQDFAVTEETVDDVKPAVQEMLLKRADGEVMRLEAESCMDEESLQKLASSLNIERNLIYRAGAPLDFNKGLMALYSLANRPDLKYSPAPPKDVPELMENDIFQKIDERDRLLFHPYHSFAPIVHLLERAAQDETVTAVYQTLYRVSGNSPIVANLAKAAENGKKVFVLFDAHARFDEENNLYWGEKLERAGCRVQYGLPNLKVHSKITLIERIENGELRRELHLGTGNYHDGTAKLYTDFGLLTADPILTQDAADFFRIFDGEDVQLREIVKANDHLQPKLLELIAREKENAENGRPAAIYAKMNSLCDKKIIKALSAASKSGVKIHLLIRGVCCILPGIESKTENIEIRSIVGRLLEHARVFIFLNDGDRQVYLSSADWMPRNLYKRVELMFPIKDERCRNAVWNVFRLQWNDTEKCRHRRTDGSFVLHRAGSEGINSQEVMLHDIDAVMDGTCRELMSLDARDALGSISDIAMQENF